MPSRRSFRKLWKPEAVVGKIRREIDRLSDHQWGWADPVPIHRGDYNGLPMRDDARQNVEDFWLPDPDIMSKYRMRFGWATEPMVNLERCGGIFITFHRDDTTGVSLYYPCGGVMLWQQFAKTKEADGVNRYERFTEESIDAGRRVSSLLHWLVTPIIKAGGMRDAVDLRD